MEHFTSASLSVLFRFATGISCSVWYGMVVSPPRFLCFVRVIEADHAIAQPESRTQHTSKDGYM